MPVTNFPNGVGSFGVPVLPGPIAPLGGPITTGKVLFVDVTNGSNGNTGTDPSSPLLTIVYALSLCTSGAGDIIYVMPGTYTVTASITVSKNKVSIIGLGGGRPGFQGVNLTASSVGAALFKVAANNVTVAGITFTGEASRACVDCSSASSFALFQDCEFIVPDSATAKAVASTADWTESAFIRCTFKGLGTITALVTIGGDNNLIQDCLMLGTGASKTVTTGILSTATTIGLLIDNLRLMERGGTVFTTGVDLTNGTYNFVSRSYSNMGTQGNFLTFTGTGNGALGSNVANGTV